MADWFKIKEELEVLEDYLTTLITDLPSRELELESHLYESMENIRKGIQFLEDK